MLIGLTGAERELFRKGLEAFETVSSVQGDAFVRKRRSDWAQQSTWTAVRDVTPTRYIPQCGRNFRRTPRITTRRRRKWKLLISVYSNLG